VSVALREAKLNLMENGFLDKVKERRAKRRAAREAAGETQGESESRNRGSGTVIPRRGEPKSKDEMSSKKSKSSGASGNKAKRRKCSRE
jgi:hypothetical protein